MAKLLLIDANALVHRAFHALPPLTTPQGKPIGAIYGLTNMLLKALNKENPHYVAAAFDTPEKTFRKEMFEAYKAHRPKAPDDLVSQIIEARKLFAKFGITTIEKPGFEADDILGTIAKKLSAKDVQVTILTGDLDALQLVENDTVTVLTLKKGVSQTITYNEEKVIERFGLKPKQLPDYKGLVGDPSDNIPGVPGVGPKTATEILTRYPTLETAYRNVDKLKPAFVKKLAGHKDLAFLSKKLATIRRDVPLEISLKDLEYETQHSKDLINYFKTLGFSSLLQRINTTPVVNLQKDQKDIVIITDAASCLTNPSSVTSKKLKVAFSWKPLIKTLSNKNIEVSNPFFDIAIAGWLLDSNQKDISLKTLALRWLNNDGNERLVLKKLYGALSQKLNSNKLERVFYDIEMPLVRILAAMEQWGIRIDTPALRQLRNSVGGELTAITNRIYKIAGTPFNLNSPHQVGEVLFEKLRLSYLWSKTTTGRYRTSESILSKLVNKHPLVPLILEYRGLFKIQSTYIEPLLEKTRVSDRVHTTFLQTATATGRLASENPNLQNIPKESRWAAPLRSCFLTEKGWKLVSFDYSQLELRLLAHISGDSKLRNAFLENKDIHALTASQVLNIPLNKVTEDQRRLAKTLNFGIIYGMGPRAFSQESKMSLEKSKQFIKEYFRDFPEVKIWQNKVVAYVKTNGYIANINGRRRWFTNAQPHTIERAAINMPIQSLGADIMKLGMIQVFSFLKKKGWLGNKARLILSIHDELLLEISDDMLNSIVPSVKTILERDICPLSVPLIVDVKQGTRWGNMKTYE